MEKTKKISNLVSIKTSSNANKLKRIAVDLPIAALHITNNIVTYNHAAELIIGYKNSEVSKLEILFKNLCIDDNTSSIYKKSKTTLTSFSEEVSIFSKNNGQRIVNLTIYFTEHEELWLLHELTDYKKALNEIRETEERFRAILEISSDWYWEQDEHYRFNFHSGLTGKAELEIQEIIGKTRWEISALNMTDQDWKAHIELLNARKPFHDLILKRAGKDGKVVYVSTSGKPIFDSNGVFKGYRGIGKNITESKLAEETIQENESRFRSLTALSSDWYWEQDENYRFTFLSEGVQSKTGLEHKSALGKTRWEIPRNRNAFTAEGWSAHKALLDARQPFYDLTVKSEDSKGHVTYVSISGEPVFNAEGKFKGYRGIGRDITKAKAVEERIEYLAYHDSLTGLPNRILFNQHLTHALNRCRRNRTQLAVLFIDLDRFKNINDTLGHGEGDKLLQEIAKRLTGKFRENDILARLGGDEFIILLEEIEESQHIATVAKKVLSILSQPFILNEHDYFITASIGISTYPEDGSDAQSLMKNADIAMYRAKDHGKNNYQFYSSKTNTHSFERLALESSLRHAVENQEFFLHYQPKINIETGELTGAEALVRWQHPHLGMVPPNQFISLAEETGLIVPIGKWVLKTACAQSVAWQAQGLKINMAVNLSLSQFADEHFLKDVAEIFRDTQVDPQLLQLEITETAVMQNAEKTITLLSTLKALGVHLAIDDFGIGYSSLAQLKRFPIDTIKIDRSFVKDLPGDEENCAITEAIIVMSKALDLHVVAEGVETKEQLEFLSNHKCNEAQGFYFSRPIPHNEFLNLKRNWG